MVLHVVCTMLVLMALVLVICQWSPRAAYRFWKHSQNLVEPDEQATETPNIRRTARTPPRRPYITPMVKKRVAARQGWRCASCKALFDETYEIDHTKALFKGGTNEESNLQALCKRCHALKSALEQSSR